MVRELVPTDWCDVDNDEDRRVVATHNVTLMLGGRPMRIDLCELHASKELSLVAWVELVSDHGYREDHVDLRPRKTSPPRKGAPPPPPPVKSVPLTTQIVESWEKAGVSAKGRQLYICPYDGKVLSVGSGTALHIRSMHPEILEAYSQ